MQWNIQCVITHRIEYFYDIRLVRASQTARDETHIELASFRCDTALMGYCPIRVLFPSTGQPHRISRKRRTFHSCTAQSHTRSYHTYGIRRFFGGRIPNETLHWNHLAAAVCLVLAVYFVFMK